MSVHTMSAVLMLTFALLASHSSAILNMPSRSPKPAVIPRNNGKLITIKQPLQEPLFVPPREPAVTTNQPSTDLEPSEDWHLLPPTTMLGRVRRKALRLVLNMIVWLFSRIAEVVSRGPRMPVTHPFEAARGKTVLVTTGRQVKSLHVVRALKDVGARVVVTDVQ